MNLGITLESDNIGNNRTSYVRYKIKEKRQSDETEDKTRKVSEFPLENTALSSLSALAPPTSLGLNISLPSSQPPSVAPSPSTNSQNSYKIGSNSLEQTRTSDKIRKARERTLIQQVSPVTQNRRTASLIVQSSPRPDYERRPIDLPSPISLIRQSSIAESDRGSPGPTPTGSENSNTPSQHPKLGDNRILTEGFDNKVRWMQEMRSEVIISLPPEITRKKLFKAVFSSFKKKGRHPSCKDIANSLKARHSIISTERSTAGKLADIITQAPDTVRTFDIVRLFVEIFSKSLETHYSDSYEARIKEELQKKYLTDHWKDDSANTRRTKFIEVEVKIQKTEKMRQKAAGILYFLFSDEHFSNTPNLGWYRVITLNMMGENKRKDTLEDLFKLVRLDGKFKDICGNFINSDPYLAIENSIKLIKKIFAEKGFMDWDRSNKEVAADVLKRILEDTLREQYEGRKGSRSIKSKQESSRTSVCSESSLKEELTPERIELLILINLGECSSHGASYSEWHKQLEIFLRNGNPDNIKLFFEPFPDLLTKYHDKLNEKKISVDKADKDKLQKITQLESTVGYFKKYSKDLKERIDEGRSIEVSNETLEHIENILLTLNKISLQMAQNMFEERVKLYYQEESRIPEQRRRHGVNPTELEETLRKAIQPKQGPWACFLLRYQQLTASSQVAQEFTYSEKLGNLHEHEVSKYSSHKKTALAVRSRVDSITSKVMLPIAEDTLGESKEGRLGLTEVEFIRNESDRRRFFFAPWMRYFRKMYMEGTELVAILQGSNSMRGFEQKKPIANAKDEDSGKATSLKETLMLRFKELLSNELVYNRLSNLGTSPIALEITENRLTQLRELRKKDPQQYQMAKEAYDKDMEQLYHTTANHPRSERLVKLGIVSHDRELAHYIENELRQYNAEPLEEKESGNGNLKMMNKPTEKVLLETEQLLVRRVFVPSEFGKDNEKEVVRLFDVLFCSTLDLDPAKLKIKRIAKQPSVIKKPQEVESDSKSSGSIEIVFV